MRFLTAMCDRDKRVQIAIMFVVASRKKSKYINWSRKVEKQNENMKTNLTEFSWGKHSKLDQASF